MVSLMLFLIQPLQPLNGGVGKEILGGRSLSLCCGAHGGGEIFFFFNESKIPLKSILQLVISIYDSVPKKSPK